MQFSEFDGYGYHDPHRRDLNLQEAGVWGLGFRAPQEHSKVGLGFRALLQILAKQTRINDYSKLWPYQGLFEVRAS